MSDDFAPHLDDGSDDSGDELAALEFFAPRVDEDHHDDLAALAPSEPDDGDDHAQVPLFTASNPPGTVTVTTYANGRVQQLDLSPQSATTTEAELAQEILAVTRLAMMKARSAQGAVLADLARERVDDEDAIHDVVGRQLGLPTLHDVTAVEQAIATRHRELG